MRSVTTSLMLLLLAPRCEGQVDTTHERIGTIEFVALSTIDSKARTIETAVSVINRGRDTTQLLAPVSCALSLRVSSAPPDVNPLWDGSRKERVCSHMLRVHALAPDSSIRFVDVDSLSVVGEHAIPGRRYYFSALLLIGRGSRLELRSGSGQLK